MASLIAGYEYDIFISYRQKDNKHDGWVTEFVSNLIGELESTFKEEISVYFDINPHDGLRETHDVDASLKEKLKCLIFIPIISRTYCDPKSFAWEHEFKAFVEMASKDRFGLKVKLQDGNVSGRVLPVCTHNLDNGDLQLCEDTLGGVLRGIEFIYKEPGVNRPLNPYDDGKENQNKTTYRNQINKITNAIREIVNSINGIHVEKDSVMKENTSARIREKSIIVLPFDNLSSDPEQEYFSDGLTEEIITDLSYINDLLVISRSSAMTFKGSKKTIPQIAHEVNVHYVLEGSVRKAGSNLRIIAQLIDALTDTHLWAEKYTGTIDDIFDIQEKVAQSISTALKLKITSAEKSKIKEVPISDINSYELYLKAKSYIWTFTKPGLDHAMELINKALENSADNALLYASRATVYWQYHNAGFEPSPDILEKAEQDAQRSLDLDPGCHAGYSAKGFIAYTKAELEESAINFRKVYDAEARSMLGYIYSLAGQMQLAKEYNVQSVHADPLNSIVLTGYSYYEIFRGNFDMAAGYLLKADELTTDFPLCQFYYALTRVYSGETEKAISAYELLIQKDSGIFGEISKMWKAALTKNMADFENLAAMLREYALRDKELSWWLADCSASMEKTEDALYWLNNSIEQGLINDIFFSKFDPVLSRYRDDSRFIALMNKARGKQERFKEILGLNIFN
jgi:TolB-like protein